MESLSIICVVLCGLAVWLWPRRNVCDVGERAGNVVGRAGESLDEKPDGGFDEISKLDIRVLHTQTSFLTHYTIKKQGKV